MGNPLANEVTKRSGIIALDSMSYVPMYSQIAGFILTAINEGRFREGDKLPTENEICEDYSVSRITARKALQELVDLGKVERKQGKGSFVLSGKVSMYAMALDGFSGFASHSEGVSRKKIISKRFSPATDKEAKWLSVKVGSSVQELVRRLSLNELPIMLDRALYSQERFPGLFDGIQDDDSTYRLLAEKYDCHVHSVNKEILYTVARSDEAAVLQCNVGEPLFLINKSVADRDNQIIHHAVSLIVASRVKLTLSYNR